MANGIIAFSEQLWYNADCKYLKEVSSWFFVLLQYLCWIYDQAFCKRGAIHSIIFFLKVELNVNIMVLSWCLIDCNILAYKVHWIYFWFSLMKIHEWKKYRWLRLASIRTCLMDPRDGLQNFRLTCNLMFLFCSIFTVWYHCYSFNI